MDKEYYGFERFVADVRTIADVVRRVQEKTGGRFKKIYGPPRGGLPLAVCLSHQLDLKLVLEDPMFETVEESGRAVYRSIHPDVLRSRGIANETLIVDDIADTGKTLQRFKDAGFFIATLYKHPQSSFDPDVWTRVKRDAWIAFWWEEADLLLNSQQI